MKLSSIAAVHYDAYSFRQKAENTHPHTPRLARSRGILKETFGYLKKAVGGIVVRGRHLTPVFEVDFWPPREGVISRGLFFGSPRLYGMWHENAISHPPREVELG